MLNKNNHIRYQTPNSPLLIAFVIIALLLSLSGTEAQAYSLRFTDAGEVVHWTRQELNVRFDASLSRLGSEEASEAVILEAMATWESSGVLPLTFIVDEGSGAELGFNRGGENHNDVMALSGDWPFDDDYSAVTISTYDAATGVLLDADIVFDANRRWSAAETPNPTHVDLLDTATHELGHLLGLEHSEVHEAAMYAIGPVGSTTRRDLHADDIDALIAIYGPPPSLGRTPSAGCSMTPAGPIGRSGGFLLLLITAVALRISRKS